MPRESILSFFSNKPDNRTATNNNVSPIKTRPKKRRIFIESDESSGENQDVNKLNEGNVLPQRRKTQEIPIEILEDSRLSLNAELPIEVKVTPTRKSSNMPIILPLPNVSPIETEGSLSSAKTNPTLAQSIVVSPVKLPFDESAIGAQHFNPLSEIFNPVDDACWRQNEPVPYIAFATTLDCIERTSARLKIITILSNFYRSVGALTPKELPMCINMSTNKLGPAYKGLELGIGESILIKALAMTTGASTDRIKSELNRLGDLGAVAEVVRSRQQTMFKPMPLMLHQVFNKLKEITMLTGHSSQLKKVKLIQTLLVACRDHEAKYLIRSLQGKLRIGLAEQSVLAALGQAVAMTPFHTVHALLVGGESLSPQVLDVSKGFKGGADAWKAHCDSISARVKQAFAQCPDYDHVVASLLEDGPENVHKRCCITPGVPLRPMLAHPTHGVSEVLKRFNEAVFTCEYKYDGERAQVHLLVDRSVRVFSRNQEDNTAKYPDIVNTLATSVLVKAKLDDRSVDILKTVSGNQSFFESRDVTSFIVDSEVVAWDRETQQILPFQVLSTRKRKDVQEDDVKVKICIYAFDLLYLNGIPLTEQPLRTRRELLRIVFPSCPGHFLFATSLDSSDTDEIGRFMEESIKGNCEGLMVKTLDDGATYEIAKRSRNWLKLKKDYLEGVGDTLDLVVIGGFHGSGKRTGRYGGFLLACYNPDDESYQTICKIGTGLKDDDLVAHSEFFKNRTIPSAKTYYEYTRGLQPDHWFEPCQVWEVKAADLSISPAHKAAAGMADPEKGLSLRFPRFLRVREDKGPEDATTAGQVYEMYCNQEQIKNTADKCGGADDEDFY